MPRRNISLKWGLMTSIVFCWIAAVIVVIYTAGVLIDFNFSRNLETTLNNDAENILTQIEMRISDCMEASKEVSYDGVVRSAYREMKNGGDSTAFYRRVTEYLSDTFSRDAKFKAVFISFWEDDVSSKMYLINQKTNSYQILQDFLTEVRPNVLETMKDADTDIRFIVHDRELYMCRNLLDSGFRPYATVTMLCDASILFQPLHPIEFLGNTVVSIDGTKILLDNDYAMLEIQDSDISPSAASYRTDVNDHELSLYITRSDFNIWTDLPGLSLAVIVALILVLPILAVLISVFYKSVTEPIETLVDAAQKVQGGERGYIIDDTANTSEFNTLYQHFNSMSAELKTQFERSQLEQQTLQQAKIKALQSQINPHFLNNTLEVINWEARIAGNDSVSEMIDALSTMLEAALDRDGTGVTTLRRELDYVDAYLYIIKKRVGERFTVNHNVDESLLDFKVPKLILQPIVENAVEHGITPRKGGRLDLNIHRESNCLVLTVIHEGIMTAEDRKNIDDILSAADPRELKELRGHVGLKNVAARLKLLYGESGVINISEESPGIITAELRLPVNLQI